MKLDNLELDNNENDKSEILKITEEFINSLNNKNTKRIKEIYHPESSEFNEVDMNEYFESNDDMIILLKAKIIDIFEERAEVEVDLVRKSKEDEEENEALTLYFRKYWGEKEWKLYNTMFKND